MRKDPEHKDRARALRRELSPAETILWKALRGRRLGKFKFRRQHPFGAYILDFFCAEARLILEVDGESHLERGPEDAQRSQWLEAQQVKVLRFWNTEVFDELEAVLEAIYRECVSRTATESPRGGG